MLSWENFEVELRRIHELASNAGVEAVRGAGFRFEAPGDMERLPHKAHRIFIRGCHYGFSLAQADVGRMVLDIDAEGAIERSRLVQARRERDSQAQHHYELLLADLRRQKQLLRRLLDEVLRQIIGTDTWVLRRLKLYNDERSVDPAVLRSTLDEAWRRNKEDRMAFHLVTDLATAVHVGDLIRVDKNEEGRRKWSIIELKTGAVNVALQELLDAVLPADTPNDLEERARAVAPKADKQVRRMIRQSVRQKRVEEIVDTHEGTHPIFEVPIFQVDTPGTTADYAGVVRELSVRLTIKDFAATVVQGCIHLFGVRKAILDKYGIGLVGHHFYHALHPDKKCALAGDEVGRKAELEEIKKTEFHDLLVVNLLADWAISFFQWPMKADNLFHIALGRHRLFAYIDYEALFAMAKRRGFLITAIPRSLKGVRGIEREHLASMSFSLPGLPDACGLRVTNPNGQEAIFMSGFVTRILAEHMLPSFWLELVADSFTRLDKAKELR